MPAFILMGSNYGLISAAIVAVLLWGGAAALTYACVKYSAPEYDTVACNYYNNKYENADCRLDLSICNKTAPCACYSPDLSHICAPDPGVRNNFSLVFTAIWACVAYIAAVAASVATGIIATSPEPPA